MKRRPSSWVLPVSVLLALLLGLVPLPDGLQPLRPYWLGLVVAYWVLEDSDRLGLGFAFSMGLIADLAFGNILGEQALAIGGLLLNDRVVSAAVHLALGLQQLPWLYWLAPVLGLLLWVPLCLVMDALRFRPRTR